jgi:hypothetical protein
MDAAGFKVPSGVFVLQKPQCQKPVRRPGFGTASVPLPFGRNGAYSVSELIP